MATTEAKVETEREEIILVYVGVREATDQSLIHVWLEVSQKEYEQGEMPPGSEFGTAECYRIYSGKTVKKNIGGFPGNVYRVPQTPGTTSIYSGEARYLGQWKDREQRLKWEMNSRTAQTAFDMRKKAKKNSGGEFEELKEFRNRYAKLVSRNQKAALLAQVIAYITAGPVRDDD